MYLTKLVSNIPRLWKTKLSTYTRKWTHLLRMPLTNICKRPDLSGFSRLVRLLVTIKNYFTNKQKSSLKSLKRANSLKSLLKVVRFTFSASTVLKKSLKFLSQWWRDSSWQRYWTPTCSTITKTLWMPYSKFITTSATSTWRCTQNSRRLTNKLLRSWNLSLVWTNELIDSVKLKFDQYVSKSPMGSLSLSINACLTILERDLVL